MSMDAKQRYRRRKKLRSALLRVLELLAAIAEEPDPLGEPDSRTAEMAADVLRKLVPFIQSAGLPIPDSSKLEHLDHFTKQKQSRQRERIRKRRSS